LETLAAVPSSPGAGSLRAIDAPLGKIPVFIRPGTVLPRKLRLRRSSKLMRFDPFTLVVAPLQGAAKGTLYLDDEFSLAHETSGAFVYRAFSFADNVLSCTAAAPLNGAAPSSSSTAVSAKGPAASAGFDAPNTVERILFAGQARAPRRVTLKVAGEEQGQELSFTFDAAKQVVTVKKPDARVVQDWTVTLEF
jgi:alpha 1,3-glucosidase